MKEYREFDFDPDGDYFVDLEIDGQDIRFTVKTGEGSDYELSPNTGGLLDQRVSRVELRGTIVFNSYVVSPEEN